MFASCTQQPPLTNFSRNTTQPPLRPPDSSELTPTDPINNNHNNLPVTQHGLPSIQVIPTKVKTLTKLERLLQQKDIFETLRKINSGQIRSYHDLPMLSGAETTDKVSSVTIATANQRRATQADDENMAGELNDIERLEKQPESLTGGQLKDYQIEGLNWLYKLYQTNLNGILADEMGLGKTIQSIAILAQVESYKTPAQIRMRATHHIVIVPKVTLGKWRQELGEWCPSLRVLTFYGNKEERNGQMID